MLEILVLVVRQGPLVPLVPVEMAVLLVELMEGYGLILASALFLVLYLIGADVVEIRAADLVEIQTGPIAIVILSPPGVEAAVRV